MDAPVELTLDHCVKCNICTSACPVAAVTERFPGPKFVGPQAARFRREGDASPDASVDYCSGCGVCSLVCPMGVQVAAINSRARAALKRRTGIPLRDRLLARPQWLGALAGPLAPAVNAALGSPLVRAAMERWLGVHRRAPLPRLATQSLRGWFSRRAGAPGAAQSATARRPGHPTSSPSPLATPRVAYFHGCAANYFEPQVGRAAIEILEALGYEVVLPDQVCCGLPLISNGDFDAARVQAARNLAALVPLARQGVPIVATSTSCGFVLKAEWREVLGLDGDDARLVAMHTYDICEFLRDVAPEAGDVARKLETAPTTTAPGGAPSPTPATTVVYHAPCQLKSHGIGRPALDLLVEIPGLSIVDLDVDCCGIAGTYGLKREKHQIAMDVGRPLFEGVGATRPAWVLCDSETCRWHIQAATGVPARHPIELIREEWFPQAAPAMAGLA